MNNELDFSYLDPVEDGYIRIFYDEDNLKIQNVSYTALKEKYYPFVDLPIKSVSIEKIIFGLSKMDIDNTNILYNTPDNFKENNKKNILRDIRKGYLNAFDIWEKAVLRGREKDSDSINLWYEKLLELDESAFKKDNIPDRILYYYGGNYE